MFAVLALVVTPGCERRAEPVRASREVLGTVVTVEAYGEDEDAVRAVIDRAFERMKEVDDTLNPYNAHTPIAEFNRRPFEPRALPEYGVEIIEAAERLGVSEYFSVSLFGVTRLYDFGGEERVPNPPDLMLATEYAREFEEVDERKRHSPGSGRWSFPALNMSPGPYPPGLDFGGAAKGLALDLAARELRASGEVDAAILSAGSSTLTFGSKPDGSPWRIGTEDPRDPGRVVAVFSTAEETASVSTSGDYQQYFERGGVRYHHILDPRTGRPARGLRSLAVAGTSSAMDTDILSTALFVMGPERAREYARLHGLALYAVDAKGRALVAPAPADTGIRLTEEAEPVR